MASPGPRVLPTGPVQARTAPAACHDLTSARKSGSVAVKYCAAWSKARPRSSRPSGSGSRRERSAVALVAALPPTPCSPVSKTTDRMPSLASSKLQDSPLMPPPMMPTTGSGRIANSKDT